MRILEIEFYKNDGHKHPDTFAEVFQRHCNHFNRKHSWLLLDDALAYRYSRNFFVLIKCIAIPRRNAYIVVSGASNVAKFVRERSKLIQDGADNLDAVLSLVKIEDQDASN